MRDEKFKRFPSSPTHIESDCYCQHREVLELWAVKRVKVIGQL